MNRIISHRGNLDGPNKKLENKILQIEQCLSLGFGVEIDCWKIENEEFFRLGHDDPNMNESVNLNFLKNENLWIHCKNQYAYDLLSNISEINCFQHTIEDYAKTSKGFIWKHNRIMPSPYLEHSFDRDIYTYYIDKSDPKWGDIVGKHFICTDYPLIYSKMIGNKK